VVCGGAQRDAGAEPARRGGGGGVNEAGRRLGEAAAEPSEAQDGRNQPAKQRWVGALGFDLAKAYVASIKPWLPPKVIVSQPLSQAITHFTI
jgi:hypothetical protein